MLNSDLVGFGSVVETNLGVFFISVGIGQLSLEAKKIYCIGQDAPISKFLLGKSVGSYQWIGKELVIEHIH